MIAVAVVVLAFAGMEGVSYVMHRFVMHGPGWRVHADHHSPPQPGFERNDLYPASFSVLAIALFALGTAGPGPGLLVAAGIGMTLYGLSYLYVHEVYVHGRLPVAKVRWPYLAWLERMHRIHHLYGGEPYGMLLPVVPRSLRARASEDEREPFTRASTRAMRTRL